MLTADTSKSGSTLLSMASGGSKGLASSQGGNEATGALQTGGSVEHTNSIQQVQQFKLAGVVLLELESMLAKPAARLK